MSGEMADRDDGPDLTPEDEELLDVAWRKIAEDDAVWPPTDAEPGNGRG